MTPDSDDPLAAILACAEAIRTEDVEAELEAAMSDPLLQEIVERAVSDHQGALTPEQLAESREALLLYFVTDPRAERLLEELRSAGGSSHVVETRGTLGDPASTPQTKPRRVRGRGSR
jgi:hypothetical protein